MEKFTSEEFVNNGAHDYLNAQLRTGDRNYMNVHCA